MKQFKILVEKHPDAYVAYPLGLKGVVVGQGETYEAALQELDMFQSPDFVIQLLVRCDEIAPEPSREFDISSIVQGDAITS